MSRGSAPPCSAIWSHAEGYLSSSPPSHTHPSADADALLSELNDSHRTGCNFYVSLIGKACVELPLSIDAAAGREGPGSMVLASFFVAIGDLTRYAEGRSAKGAKRPPDWRSTKAFYHLALRCSCSSGKVHNTLGVVANNDGDGFAAVLQYLRSLFSKAPFKPSLNTLRSLLQKIGQKSESSGGHAKASDFAKMAMHVFRQQFLRAHAYILTQDAANCRRVPELTRQCCNELQGLLKVDYEGGVGGFLEKVVMLGIASMLHVADSPVGRGVASALPPVEHWTELTRLAVRTFLLVLQPILQAAQQNLSSSDSHYLAPVCMALDWITLNPCIQSCEVADVAEAWAQAAGALKELLSHQLVIKDRAPQHPQDPKQGLLSEDMAARGFVPLAPLLEARVRQHPLDRRSSKGEPKAYTGGKANYIHLRRLRTFALANPGLTDGAVEPDRLPKQQPSGVKGGAYAGSAMHGLAPKPNQMPLPQAFESEADMDAAWNAAGLGGQPAAKPARSPPVLWEPTEVSPAPAPKPKPKPKAAPAPAPQNGLPPGVLKFKPMDIDSLMPKIGEAKTKGPGAMGSDSALVIGARTVVLDLPNIAMRHGECNKGSGQKTFSCKGIEIAIQYYKSRGHQVLGFMPEYYLDKESVGKQKRAQKLGIQNKPQKVPDDVELLSKLMDEGYIYITPPGDYDDSYSIDHAKKNGGINVSNDRYRDSYEEDLRSDNRDVAHEARKQRDWIRTHVCSYTFVKDDFMANPDFKWPPNESSTA
jgi:hypothetical protein